MDRNLGLVLDSRYEIVELIGIGGMADVYKATDIMENKTVAVKILKTEFAKNEEFLRRFRNESKAIAVLSHPNIVKVYDVGFTANLQYIVMEYIDGITLKEYLEHQKFLKWKEAIYFINQILKAVQHAHDKGIVHRDIKPQNIMLFTNGSIKVMDFGIARFARQDGKNMSEKTVGSVHYISPEQASGGLTDDKSDIYSIGAMFFEMVTGEKPFDGDTPVEIALCHISSLPPIPSEIMGDIPKGFDEIILKAMEKNPEKRYQSAASMIRDFDAVKKNPEVTFGYVFVRKPVVTEDTVIMNPVQKPAPEKKENIIKKSISASFPIIKKPKTVAELADEIEEEQEDEVIEYTRKPSFIVSMLLGVTVAFVIAAAVFITIMIFDNLNIQKTDRVMPNLIGMEFTIAQENYDFIRFVIDQDYSDEYPAGYIIDQEKNPGRTIADKEKIDVVVSLGPELVAVPNVTNLSYETASETLENLGFTVVRVDEFHDTIINEFVVSTNPVAMELLTLGSQVTVSVSVGPIDQEVTVPNVLGLMEEEARTVMQEAKLTPIFVPKNSVEPAGTVISQEFLAGTIVKRGDEVQIAISTGEVRDGAAALTIKVPKLLSGEDYNAGFIIDAYVEGSLRGSRTIDNINDISSFILEVEGEGVKEVEIRVTSLATYNTEVLGVFEVDFEEGVQLAELDFFPNALFNAEKDE